MPQEPQNPHQPGQVFHPQSRVEPSNDGSLQPDAQKAAAAQQTKKLLHKILRVLAITLIALVIVILLGGVWWFMQAKNSKKQATQTLSTFIQHLEDGKTEEAYALTSSGFQKEYQKEAFNTTFNSQEIRQSLGTSYKVISVKNSKNLKTYPVMIEAETTVLSQKLKIKAVFIKDNGQWFLDAIIVPPN